MQSRHRYRHYRRTASVGRFWGCLLTLAIVVAFATACWPALVGLFALGLALGLVAALAARHRVASLRWQARSLAEVDTMTGPEFERYLAAALRQLGWQVVHTGRSGDRGCDLLLLGGGVRVAVQCKRWGHAVGLSAVMQAQLAKAVYGAGTAWVVTSNRFAPAAYRAAAAWGVRLIDRRQLADLLREAASRRALDNYARPVYN